MHREQVQAVLYIIYTLKVYIGPIRMPALPIIDHIHRSCRVDFFVYLQGILVADLV
jgi:hypothetical protein